MASKNLGQALIDIGKIIPSTYRANRQSDEDRRIADIRERMMREELLAAELERSLKGREAARKISAGEAMSRALEYMTKPQQEPILSLKEPPKFNPTAGMPDKQEGLSVGGDISKLTEKYLPEQEVKPYKAPMGSEEALVASGAAQYFDQPEVKDFQKAFSGQEKNGYGKSSVGAALEFTEKHPELVQEGINILQKLKEEGKYSDVLLQTIAGNLRTDVRQALRDLNNLQGRTEEKVRSLFETMPGEVEKAAKTSAARTSAGIISEYETQKDIPGSFKQSQYTAGNYASRIEQAESVLSELGKKGFDPGNIYNQIKSIDALNAIKDPNQRRYAQAMRNFINATLRRESGAVINKDEFTNANKQYFAQLNDDKKTLAQKRENRLIVFDAFKTEAGGAYEQIIKQTKSRTNQGIPEFDSEEEARSAGYKNGDRIKIRGLGLGVLE